MRNLVEVTVSAEKQAPAMDGSVVLQLQAEAAVRLLRLEACSLKCVFRKILIFPSFSSVC